MTKSETVETIATIEEVTTVVPEQMMIRNAKFAIVSYVVDGYKYIAKKSITVPIFFQVGDTVKIRYEKDDPTKFKRISPRFV